MLLRILLIAVLATIAAPAPAPAHPSVGLAIAERIWPSACTGQTTATLDPTLPTRNADGEATGLRATWTGTEWVWRTEACEYTYGPNLTPFARCRVDIHEYLHLALGQYEHTGPLHPDTLEPVIGRVCEHLQANAPDPLSPHLLTDQLPPGSPRAEVHDAVRAALPGRASGWRVTCTSLRPRMRCRATRARSVRRFSVRRSDDEITVQRIGVAS